MAADESRLLITTHVLDTSIGKPAAGVDVSLERQEGEGWRAVARGFTNADGRVVDLVPPGTLLRAALYRLTFDTGAYFAARSRVSFHPRIAVEFSVDDPAAHYHVPLLVSPFGYTTYRGS
jgi:5-hydroxyisourate hydrolase